MFDKLTIILLVVIGLGGTGGYLLYSKQSAELKAVQIQNSALQSAIEETNLALETMQANTEAQQQELLDLYARMKTVAEASGELAKLLQEHDLTKLAEEKPGLIDERINNATNDIFDSIEQFTNSR